MIDKKIVSRVETILYDDKNNQKIIIESTCHKKKGESCESIKSEPNQTYATCYEDNDAEKNEASCSDEGKERKNSIENDTLTQKESCYSSCKCHSEEYFNDSCSKICTCSCNCPCKQTSYDNTTGSNTVYNYQTRQQAQSEPCQCYCHLAPMNTNYYNTTQNYNTSYRKLQQPCQCNNTNNVCMPSSVPVITYSHSPAMIVSPVSVGYVQPPPVHNSSNTMYSTMNYKTSQTPYISLSPKPWVSTARVACQNPQNINYVVQNSVPTYSTVIPSHYTQQVSNSTVQHPYVSTVSSAVTTNQASNASGLSITIPMSSEKAEGKTKSKGYVELDIPGYGKYNVPFKLKAKKK